MNKLRFTKVREVPSPSRGNAGDAGLDFYIPTNLTPIELMGTSVNTEQQIRYACDLNTNHIQVIEIPPHCRVLIPSGIKVLIEPRESMLMASNKSGISTNQGLIFTAEIVDSPYVGEVHIGIVNTSNYLVRLEAGKKVVQFIHVPVYLTEPEEIQQEEYYSESRMWGSRGANGFGSTGDR